MPVIFHKRSRPPEPDVPPPPAEEVVVAPPLPPQVPLARPGFTKILHVGKAEILPDIDVHDVLGRTKFLVNLFKMEQNQTAIWYRIISYDEYTENLKLCSRHKNVFDAKMHPTVAQHYIVVMEPEGASEPSKAAIIEIRKMMTVDPIVPAPPAPSVKKKK
jgi:hypothetical protein